MARGAAQTIPAKTRPGAAAAVSAPRPGPGVGLFENDINNTLRRLAFRVGLAVVFLRFSLLQALLTGTIHVNLRLLYIFGLPALVGVVLSGGLRRSFQGRLAWYWVGYAAWMAAAVPFSMWKGGSASLVFGFLRADFPVMLIIAGLAMTWRECRALLHTVAWAAVVSVAAMPAFEQDFGGRAGLEFGTVANPNDYAAHLMLVLPFLLWVGSNAKLALVRFGAIGGVALGMAMVLKTASRGAAVALVVAILFFLFRAPVRQRIALVLLAPVAAAILFAAVPRSAIDRISSLAHAGTSADTEYESTMARSYLFWKSVEFTVKHPVFGVGPGMFADYEGRTSREDARRGAWHDAHNT
ncbi:MAG TPA: O-antigen ligase family protein, partial [Bryobacteraceae bacterium]